ncbi:hypothetical protein [Amnibacterium kyonggiense]|uniref:Lipoprotein n=1 Tax=Amnibacterium kyonggiense TaxID=595671 RepID=A0A4R7FS77_9MICO|nr:hypothetical protein [Amnibacterium kyonggiense]TDS80683.1 hypothetical protein CLV52_1249 [Amnibacterium kyonggiense]
MRTATKSITALLSAGLVVAALAGCSQSGTGDPNSSGAGNGSSSSSATPSASPTPAAVFTSVSGKTTQITLDSGFVSALTSLKLTPGTIGSATLSKAGVLTFPITGGNITYYDPATKVRPYVQGELDHSGSGLSLTAGGTKVELKDFVIDPGNNSHVNGDVYVNGKEAAKGANLFRLDGSTLNPVTKDGDAYILEGTTVYISDEAAKLLNATFKTTAVTGELKVGIAKLTVTGS